MLLWKILTSATRVLEVHGCVEGKKRVVGSPSKRPPPEECPSNFVTDVVEDPEEEEICISEEDFDPTNWNSKTFICSFLFQLCMHIPYNLINVAANLFLLLACANIDVTQVTLTSLQVCRTVKMNYITFRKHGVHRVCPRLEDVCRKVTTNILNPYADRDIIRVSEMFV